MKGRSDSPTSPLPRTLYPSTCPTTIHTYPSGIEKGRNMAWLGFGQAFWEEEDIVLQAACFTYTLLSCKT